MKQFFTRQLTDKSSNLQIFRSSNLIYSLLLPLVVLSSCRHDITIIDSDNHEIGDTLKGLHGFYLLNEGNLGSNKASLDYYDFATGVYTTDIYAQRNPSVVKELGDVGNDLKIYGNRLYAVINASNKIEVMTADSAKRIGQIDVPNCRCLAFDGQYGYVTSYAGPIMIGDTHAQIGYVLKFDTATLQPLDTCHVGFQPEGIATSNSKLYVANSGGYMASVYDSTLSVIDINSFQEIKRLTVDVNMQHVTADRYGQLWVNSLGDYYDRPSRLYCIDTETESITALPFAASNFCIEGDSLYFYSVAWSYVDMANTISFGIVDIKTHQLLSQQFITDGTETDIEVPYGICVNPITKDIYITDAKTYVIPGVLYCYTPDGVRKWSVRTGDIPGHFAIY